MHARRNTMPRIVNAGGDPMAAVGFHAGAAAAENGEEDDGAEGGK